MLCWPQYFPCWVCFQPKATLSSKDAMCILQITVVSQETQIILRRFCSISVWKRGPGGKRTSKKTSSREERVEVWNKKRFGRIGSSDLVWRELSVPPDASALGEGNSICRLPFPKVTEEGSSDWQGLNVLQLPCSPCSWVMAGRVWGG